MASRIDHQPDGQGVALDEATQHQAQLHTHFTARQTIGERMQMESLLAVMSDTSADYIRQLALNTTATVTTIPTTVTTIPTTRSRTLRSLTERRRRIGPLVVGGDDKLAECCVCYGARRYFASAFQCVHTLCVACTCNLVRHQCPMCRAKGRVSDSDEPLVGSGVESASEELASLFVNGRHVYGDGTTRANWLTAMMQTATVYYDGGGDNSDNDGGWSVESVD
jgi:hypothetical protein